MDGLPAKLRQDDNQLREAARRVLRRGLNERFGKRPLIEIQLVRL
jgi:ribonuclease J